MAARSTARRAAGAVIHRATILFFLAFAVFPFYWMVVTSFKQNADLYVGAIGRIVLPLAVPGLLTVVIFALTLVIQEFVYSLTVISSVEKMTVSVGVPVALVRGDVYYWGSLMAACLITSVPIAIVYNFFLDRFIAGFTVGAIK